jgi:hypothetical protein
MKTKNLLFTLLLVTSSVIAQASTISGTVTPTNTSSTTICNGSAIIAANNVPSGDYVSIDYYNLNSPNIILGSKAYNTVATYTITNLCTGNYFAVISCYGNTGNDTVTVNFVISSPTVTTTPTSTVATTSPVLYDTSLTYIDSLKVDTLINQINTCSNMYNSSSPIRIAHTVYIQDSIRVTWKYDNSTDSINTTYKYSRYGVYRIMAILWCADTTGIGLRSAPSATITFVSDIYINPNSVTTTTTGIQNIKKSSLLIYPNPSIGVFTIDFNTESSNGYSIVITDLLGETVYKSKVNQQKVIVDLSKLLGIYIVHIIDMEGKIIDRHKILLQ